MGLEEDLIHAARYGSSRDIERVLRRVELGGKLDLNTKDSDGNTAMHLLASRGLTAAIDLLLRAGAKGNLTNRKTLTPLDLALANGHMELMDLLREREAAGEDSARKSAESGHSEGGFAVECPYCGKKMKEAGPAGLIVAASCEGESVRGHAMINVSRLDNKFRTLDPAIAEQLKIKGFSVQFNSEGRYYEIAHMPPKAGEESSQARTNFDLGCAFWKSGDRRRAMDIWEANVRQYPTHRDSWYNLGLAYGRDDQFQRAVECLKKAVEIAPSDGQAWWYLGYSYRLGGDEGNSRQAYARAKALGWHQAPLGGRRLLWM